MERACAVSTFLINFYSIHGVTPGISGTETNDRQKLSQLIQATIFTFHFLAERHLIWESCCVLACQWAAQQRDEAGRNTASLFLSYCHGQAYINWVCRSFEFESKIKFVPKKFFSQLAREIYVLIYWPSLNHHCPPTTFHLQREAVIFRSQAYDPMTQNRILFFFPQDIVI